MTRELLVCFALARVRVCIAAQLDLFDTVVAAHLWRLLMMEASAANRAADTALHANHLVAHVLIWALIGVS